ncbi:Mariner Mos1 transposase [Aphis craccivora]|uniref:Mariner Mos1 transposase n=1 Tax=Aphis craccivora TaxID=307492 RepID=A0A6G0YTG7_APHCR|nr:Mariner Mos1 transposase [Aphis craccivora]
MNKIHEQRINITFYVKLGKSFTKTHKIYGYDVETKLQSSERWVGKLCSRLKKACQSHANGFVSFFFTNIHHKFLPAGQTVN